MAKTKKQNIHLPLVAIGYVLFSLIVIETLISTTIPFGVLLFNPRVLHFNVAVTLVALTIGAILPVLLGYVIGGQAIKTKNKLSHQFTGMLFGLLAYWIMTLLALFITIPPEFLQDDRNGRLVIMSLLPGVGVALIATILSIAHVRSRHAKQDILTYRPFSVLLITSIVVLPLWSLIQNAMTGSVAMYSFVPLIIVLVSGVISYTTLRKTKLSLSDKIAWTSVSVSVLFISVYTLSIFVSAVSNYLFRTPTMETMALVSWAGFALAITMWGLYWFKQARVLR